VAERQAGDRAAGGRRDGRQDHRGLQARGHALTQFAQTLLLGVLVGGVYALVASGLTLIFGVMRVINIAHGAFLILAAFLTYSLWKAAGIDPLVAIVFTTPAMFAFGWAVYLLAVRRIRGTHMSASVLLTFALALVVEGLLGIIWGNTSHSVRPSYFNESFDLGPLFAPKAQVYGFVVAAAVLAALYVILTRTWLGRAIRASAVNPDGAALVGVNVGGVAALTFAVGVGATGAGGSIVSVLYPFLPGSHYEWIARVLSIVVLGGLGSLPGAAIGALLLGIAEAATQTYISPAWAGAVPYVVIFVVLLVRPQGLLGARLREDVAPA
jgi:branched-chain amino acid transport system permease protein